jgi:RNA polymerase sigma-70 factor (ECF subfamily)
MEADLILDGAMTEDGSFELEDFERIVIDHQQQIYRTLLLLVRDHDAAEILTQECFLRAFESRGSFRGESSLSTWLIRIAINLAKDHNRNQRWAFWRRIGHIDPTSKLRVVDVRHSPEEHLIETEQVLAIRSALEELSERQRIVFLVSVK